ncbi:HNH endonuclease [Brevundimonas sp. LjRoot202]|uniref:HNH endonuclease n=1 Tax=Brevundimonas sp. LjRoot202 TaxID=3342281 RepID=UPI003ED0E600
MNWGADAVSALSAALSKLTPQHRTALEWFWSRRGELIGWPEPLDGLFLVNRPKGIHKPEGWVHALSVRQALKGPYPDKPVSGSFEDGWTYDYFQEGQRPEDRDKYAGNRGLMACKADGVPVAVLIQEKPKPGVQYRVWGLAEVVDFDAGYFRLRGFSADGNLKTPHPGAGLDFAYPQPEPSLAHAADHPPLSLDDARRRIETQIVERQGGKAFREEALKRFSSRCAVTGWNVPEVLEAAHIVPYLGEHTNRPDNALLLRSDIHTLFDRDLLAIDPETLRVRLSGTLDQGPYAEFSGKGVALPTGIAPETLRARLLERIEALKPKTFQA